MIRFDKPETSLIKLSLKSYNDLSFLQKVDTWPESRHEIK